MSIDLTGDDLCFVCGVKNPIGLKLKFAWEGEEYVTYFTPQQEHQGWVNITHGGLISTILDEVMGRSLCEKQIPVVTARMELRFRLPIPIGETVRFSGRVVKEKGKVIDMEAKAQLADGQIATEATARFLVQSGGYDLG